MKQALQQRASRQMTMTPQLQLSIRLLQLSALEFEQEVEQALANNPFLERNEDGADATAEAANTGMDVMAAASDAPGETCIACEDAVADTDDFRPDDWGRVSRHNDEEGEEEAEVGSFTATQTSLREHVLAQVRASRLSHRDQALVATLADALDECGYLRQSLDEVRALWRGEMGAAEEVTADELAVALRFLQSLDPSGVGARSLAECLALQLDQLPAEIPGRALALVIVRDHLPLLAAHDTLSLTRALRCDEPALREANCLIKHLDPHPGLRYADNDTRYVVADVIVKKAKDKWVATINPEVLPRIHVNRVYADILRNSRAARSSLLGQQLQEARWLIRNVQQRFQTIQRVAQAVVDRQSRFFDYGEIAMKPLILRDIADKLGLHESTVSRVTSNKYMATPRGLIEFKYFFCNRVMTEEGNAYSATAIRALIKQIIAAEDARNPLSDIKIAKMLGARGIAVARRTVSKYRDAMRIAPVEARRLSLPEPAVIERATAGTQSLSS